MSSTLAIAGVLHHGLILNGFSINKHERVFDMKLVLVSRLTGEVVDDIREAFDRYSQGEEFDVFQENPWKLVGIWVALYPVSIDIE